MTKQRPEAFSQFADRVTGQIMEYIRHNYSILSTVEIKGNTCYIRRPEGMLYITIEAEET